MLLNGAAAVLSCTKPTSLLVTALPLSMVFRLLLARVSTMFWVVPANMTSMVPDERLASRAWSSTIGRNSTWSR